MRGDGPREPLLERVEIVVEPRHRADVRQRWSLPPLLRAARRYRRRRAGTARPRSRTRRAARRAPPARGSGARSRAGTCTRRRRAGRGRAAARCGRTRAGRTARATPRGVVISRIPSRPPGRSTRRSSRSARLEVVDVADPEADDGRVEARVLERQREHVALHPLELGRLAPRALEHPLGEVEADDVARAGRLRAATARSPVPQQASRTRSPGRTASRTVAARQRWSSPTVMTRFIAS